MATSFTYMNVDQLLQDQVLCETLLSIHVTHTSSLIPQTVTELPLIYFGGGGLRISLKKKVGFSIH